MQRWEITKLGWCGYIINQGLVLEYSVSSGDTELLKSGELGAKLAGQKEQNIAFPGEEMTMSKGWFWLELSQTVWPGVQPVSRGRVGRAAQQHPRRVTQPCLRQGRKLPRGAAQEAAGQKGLSRCPWGTETAHRYMMVHAALPALSLPPRGFEDNL